MGTEQEAQPSYRRRRLVFSAQSSSVDLWRSPLEPGTGRARAEPVPLTLDVASEQLHTISENGRRLAFISTRLGNPDVWVRDLASGEEKPLTATPEGEDAPVIDRAGRRVFYYTNGSAGASDAVWAVDAGGGVPSRICEDCGAPTDVSRDGRWLVLQYFGDEQSLHVLDLTSGARTPLLRHEEYGVYRGHLSPDDRWVVFHASHRRDGGTREWIAPFRPAGTVQEREWVPVTDGLGYADAPRWSPDGTRVYFAADRDGSVCVWAQPLEAATKRPQGEPVAVQHLHGRQLGIRGVSVGWLDLGIAGESLVFNMVRHRGNIWAAEFQ